MAACGFQCAGTGDSVQRLALYGLARSDGNEVANQTKRADENDPFHPNCWIIFSHRVTEDTESAKGWVLLRIGNGAEMDIPRRAAEGAEHPLKKHPFSPFVFLRVHSWFNLSPLCVICVIKRSGRMKMIPFSASRVGWVCCTLCILFRGRQIRNPNKEVNAKMLLPRGFGAENAEHRKEKPLRTFAISASLR